MNRLPRNNGSLRFGKWVLILALGALAGFSVALRGVRSATDEPNQSRIAGLETSKAEAALNGAFPPSGPDVVGVALRYARGYQAGDGDIVIESTEWMQERMRRVRLRANSAEDVERVRGELKRRVLDRAAEHNMLRPEGIEDNLVFRPESMVEPIRVDEGHADLEKPAAGRAWLKVTFLKPEQAPIGPAGKPIRSVCVGVNVSREGTVLKAAIIGNLDVDMNSVEYHSPERTGGSNDAVSQL